jgi:hypothetical protein
MMMMMMMIEIQRKWNMKCFVITVITGAMRTVSKSLKNLETIPGQHSVDSLQQTVVLTHIIRKVLQYERESLRDMVHHGPREVPN